MPSMRPPCTSSASATRRRSRRSGSTGWRRSASRSGRTTRSSSGCRSDRRRGPPPRHLPRRSASIPPPPVVEEPVVIDERDPRFRRRRGPVGTRGGPRNRFARAVHHRRRRTPGPVRPLTRPGSSQRLIDQRCHRQGEEADHGGRRHPEGGEQEREQHQGAHPNPPGASIPLGDLAALHACRLPPRLEPRPIADHAGAPMLPLASRPLVAAPSAPAVARRRPRRRWIALVVVVVVLALAVLGASLVSVPYVTLRPGSTRPVTERVLVEGARATHRRSRSPTPR